MRIDIIAIGSRGDVQPYVALGVGLRMAGHRVRIVTLGGFDDLVAGRGLDHISIADSPNEIANSAAGRSWIKNRSSSVGFLLGFVRVAATQIEDGIARYWQAGQDAEVLIASPMALLVAVHIAERLRVPLIRAQVEPPAITTHYSWDGRKSLGTAIHGRVRAGVHAAFHLVIWSTLRGSANNARRRTLDLPPLPLLPRRDKPLPLMCGYSPTVVPRLPDFGDWLHVTGYWFLDDIPGWAPPRDLVNFLASGPPPVFVGFGSTPFPKPEATTELVVRALTRSGHRGIVVAGGSGLATGQLADNVFGIDFAPYSWLFPQVSAAVHQGGAGVTALALRAGLPSVIVPVFGIHPFWGSRIFELGAGPSPIPAPRLTEDGLVTAIRATSTAEMRRRAAELGEKIRAEDGIARAIEIIEEHMRGSSVNSVRHQHAH